MGDPRYPTIARLADISQTTVGYQGPELVRESVECFHENAALAAKVAELEEDYMQGVTLTDWSNGPDGRPLQIRECSAAEILDVVLDELAALKPSGAQPIAVCEHGKGLTDYCLPCGRVNGIMSAADLLRELMNVQLVRNALENYALVSTPGDILRKRIDALLAQPEGAQ